jgi:hypothetical protein
MTAFRKYLVPRAEFGGKGDRKENRKFLITIAWHRRKA